MNKLNWIGSVLTVLFVVGLILYRLLWAMSSVASSTGLGRLSQFPQSWRRWLLGESKTDQVPPTRS